MLKFLLTSLLFIFSSVSEASESCNLITQESNLSNIEPELFEQCVTFENRWFWSVGLRAPSIFFRATTSNIEPTILDRFKNVYPEAEFQNYVHLVNLPNHIGETLFEHGINNRVPPENLIRLFSLGFFENTDALLDDIYEMKVALNEELTDVAAILKLYDVPLAVSKRISTYKYYDQVALFAPTKWKDIKYWTDGINTEVDQNYDCEQLKVLNVDVELIKTLQPNQFLNCSSVDFVEQSYFDGGVDFIHLLAEYLENASVLDIFLASITEEERERILKKRASNNYSAIHFASAFNNNPSMISHLVAWGADPNEPVLNPNTVGTFSFEKEFTRPIHLVARRSDQQAFLIALRLLAHDAAPFSRNEKGDNALHILLKNPRPNLNILTLLLESQKLQYWFSGIRGSVAEITSQDDNPPMLLYLGAQLSDNSDVKVVPSDTHEDVQKILTELLRYGASPDTTGTKEYTPILLYALTGEDPSSFNLLLEKSKQMCTVKNETGFTVLAGLKNNEALKNSQILLNGKWTTPLALYGNKCQ